ncbi:AraC family transcriptional regulator [Paenibacillus pectinilyticus]|nr:AraC family transcriptional regulator [Paenibacillus pectinilyticus]
MEQPLRKSFFNDPMFPFEMVYRDRKSPQHELPEHLHDRYELVYIYEGRGTFLLNHNFYDMSEGDLFVIPGNTIHRAFPDTEVPVLSTALFFSPSLVRIPSLGDTHFILSSFEWARKRRKYKVNIPEALRGTFMSIIEQIKMELEDRKSGYKHAICLQLQFLLLQLNRLMSQVQSETEDPVHSVPQWMQSLLLFIDLHHTENDLCLTTLSKRASVSTSHLSRAFKQYTGISVIDYVNAKRIANTKEMLLTSDSSLEIIAQKCGFESLSHFHRLFKLLTGVTPGAYRRGNQLFKG